MRTKDTSLAWELRLYRKGKNETVVVLGTRFPSLGNPSIHRSFDWAPNREELVFAHGHTLYSFAGGNLARLSRTKALRAIERRTPQRRVATFDPILRFSPDGRHIAVGTHFSVGIFRADGSLLKIVPGLFRGWSGNEGVLTVPVPGGAQIAGSPNLPSLYLHPVGRATSSRLIAKGFKTAIVTDPAGEWFAHVDPRGGRFVVFRRVDGSRLSRIDVPFRPAVIEAISSAGVAWKSPWP